MVVQHNIAAMNSNEANRKNVTGLKKRTEKLSTGYKINRAADNAAGLGVSEKMRSQINGLSQASCNSNDAVSLIQTAEGGLSESEDIVQRMRELAVQAANGTYTDDDRKQMQYEIDALKSEVNRVAEATEFNTIKLLDGSKSGRTSSTEYGARYGIIAGEGAGSLAGAILTANIAGVNVIARPDASGRGGENAFWSDDGKTLTMNLTAGEIYPQSEIDSIIKNATHAKAALAAPPEITLSFDPAFLRYEGDIADTGATVGGARAVGSGDLRRLVNPEKDPEDGQEDSADMITFTANTYGKPSDLGYAHSIEIRIDVAAGREAVDVKECEGYKGAKDLILHLATGVTYTESDFENLLAKAGFDYSVDLSDQTRPDADSDEHIRFLHSADVPFTERVFRYSAPTPVTETEPLDGVEYFTYETGAVTVLTGITEFLSGYHYYYEDTGARVPTGEAADPNRTYKLIASNATKVPLQPGEPFDPANTYYKLVDRTDVYPPSLPASSTREVTADTVPDPDKKYFVSDPGEYEVADTSHGFLNGIIYYYKDSNGKYQQTYGQQFDSSKTYYLQKRAPKFIEVDTSSGEFPPGVEIYEDKEVEIPAYGTWIELRGGQGVGYEQFAKNGDGLVFQIGANGVEDQKLYVTIDDMRAEALGLDDVFIDPIERALEALGIIDGALNSISTQRSKLGAFQNRLEYTTNSLNNANQNLSAAESQIRDTDMALEMTAYVKDNILQQSSQAMLAQANQQLQGILQLLG